MKRRLHKVKLEALEDPTMLTNVGWQIIPQSWSYNVCSQYVMVPHGQEMATFLT